MIPIFNKEEKQFTSNSCTQISKEKTTEFDFCLSKDLLSMLDDCSLDTPEKINSENQLSSFESSQFNSTMLASNSNTVRDRPFYNSFPFSDNDLNSMNNTSFDKYFNAFSSSNTRYYSTVVREEFAESAEKSYRINGYAQEAPKLGWTCTNCTNFNFESRRLCNICLKSRVSQKSESICKMSSIQTSELPIFSYRSSAEKQETKKSKKVIERAGDWTCNNCSNLNFSFRLVCNRCNSRKTNELLLSDFNEKSGKYEKNIVVEKNTNFLETSNYFELDKGIHQNSLKGNTKLGKSLQGI